MDGTHSIQKIECVYDPGSHHHSLLAFHFIYKVIDDAHILTKKTRKNTIIKRTESNLNKLHTQTTKKQQKTNEWTYSDTFTVRRDE